MCIYYIFSTFISQVMVLKDDGILFSDTVHYSQRSFSIGQYENVAFHFLVTTKSDFSSSFVELIC